MNVIAIVCQKGGVGKSTTSLNLGAGLSRRGKKLLFIDLDAQANLTETLGGHSNLTSFEILTQEMDIKDVIQKVELGDLIAAGPSLSGADIRVTEVGREYRLKKALEKVKDNYDYVVIDTPPALGILTVNALTAANEAIVTVQADVYSLKAIGQLSLTVEAVREHCNHDLKINGILLTRHSARAVLSRDMAEMIEETAKVLNTKVFDANIREAIAIKESQAVQQDIFTYAPKSAVAGDYDDFVNEFLKKG